MKNIYTICISLLIIFVFQSSINVLAGPYKSPDQKEEIPPAFEIMSPLNKWADKIENFGINFSISYKSPDGKIIRVERRKIAFKKMRSLFSFFRYDLIHPEKITFLVSPEKYVRYNNQINEIEEELILNPEKPDAGTTHGEVTSGLAKTHIKALEIYSGIEIPGATLPEGFNSKSVMAKATVIKEMIYKNKLCYIVHAKSLNSEGHFWITKDNNNLLKYVVTHPESKKEVVEVLKKRKIYEDLYIPIEVKKTIFDSEGSVSEIVHVRYYGYAVNRKLSPNTFKLRF